MTACDAKTSVQRVLSVVGVSKNSLFPLSVLAIIIALSALVWRQWLDWDASVDPLLTVLWVGMGILLCLHVSLRADALLALSALAGGFLIEWWGTNTSLWTYFSGERPPLWIVPAWPVAALATDRLARPLESELRKIPELLARILVQLSLGLFVVCMGYFARSTLDQFSSRVVLAIMVLVTVIRPNAPRVMASFLAGSALGWLLEYWGTTRGCWTYHTGETPPLVTAFAHGFAAVSFGYVARVLDRGLKSCARWLGRDATSS